MNHVYRLVWNASKGVMVAVAETASGQGKGGRRSRAARKLLARAMALGSIAAAASAMANGALPVGGVVSAGQASISTNGATMNVLQSSQRAAINWQSFNIGTGATVNFQQPNASAVALNRVVGNEQSVINGALNANGNVYLLNANGVLFNRNAQVNVGGLVASTLDISDADFMAGKTTFEAGANRGRVINLGQLTAANGGHIALLGQQVANEGVIQATLGSAILAAGDKVTLNFNGDALVGVTVDRGTLSALVENKQAIVADGGLVTLTAKGLDEVMRTVVNNTGEIRAQTIEEKNGKIYLLGGMANDRIEVDGKLDASAPNTGDGGFIETSAANVVLKDTKLVTTKATNGKTGTFLIDPNDYTIAASGGNITGSQLGTDLASNNVQISTATQGTSGGNGDIHVNDTVTWTSSNTLTLTAERNININATLDASGGSGGKVVLEYGQGAVATGNTADYNIVRNVSINLQDGQNFSTKLGSDGAVVDYTVVNSVSALQAINTDTTTLSGNWALGSDVDLTGITWTPIGADSAKFTGNFTGLGHTVDNLTINNTAADFQGLFGVTYGSVLRDVGVVNASINGRYNVGALIAVSEDAFIKNTHSSGSIQGYSTVGGLLGALDAVNSVSSITNSNSSAMVVVRDQMDGKAGGLIGAVSGFADHLVTVSNSYATGNVTGTRNLGGFVGSSSYADYSRSYATGNVTGTVSATYIGGFAGNFTAGNSISHSYASGNVAGDDSVGGLIGSSSGSEISKVYSIGNVAASWGWAGGLIGQTENSTISTAHATGSVSADMAGGLIGYSMGGDSVSNAYWDITTTGQEYDMGGSSTGINNTEAYTQATYTGFDFTNDWFSVEGYTRPFLRMEWTPVVSNAHQLQMMSSKLASNNVISYKLANDIDLAPSLTNKSEMWKDTSLTVDFDNYQGSFVPIGDRVNGLTALHNFFGSFDGQDFTIDNLYIHRPSLDLVGLFGEVDGGVFQNIKLSNANVSGRNGVGALMGGINSSDTLIPEYSSATISNIEIVDATIRGNNQIGGLAGQDGYNSVISDISIVDVDIESDGDSVGGVIGYAFGLDLQNASVSGTITAAEDSVGGLIGYLDGSIGYTSSVVNSSSSAAVSGGQQVGGLFGYLAGTTVEQSHATGAVTGSNSVGGLVGYTGSTNVTNSHATGAVNGANNTGGLLGYADAGTQVNSSYATGNITVNESDSAYIGGLVGRLYDAELNRVYATGDITVAVNTGSVGGLVGYMDGENDAIAIINESYATGDVGIRSASQATNNYSGGLVGYMIDGEIYKSFATGNVDGNVSVGGLVGYIADSARNINDNYATGNVTGNLDVGGLIGTAYGVVNEIERNYATGLVTGNIQVGGLVGLVVYGGADAPYSSFAASDNFWDTTTSGQTVAFNWDTGTAESNAIGVTGKITAQMHEIVTYRGTDSTNPVWSIAAADVSNPYPTLRWSTDLDGESVWVMPYKPLDGEATFVDTILRDGNQVTDGSNTLSLVNNRLTLTSGAVTLTQEQTGAGYIADDFKLGAVTIVNETGRDDMLITQQFSWSGYDLTLSSQGDISIKAPITSNNVNDGLTLKYGQGDVAEDNMAVYGFGMHASGFAGKINLHAGQDFSTVLGSDGEAINYTVITALGAAGDETINPGNSLQGLGHADNLSGNFVLGADIDASATASWNSGNGFTPIGQYVISTNTDTRFTGKFNGLGHSISDLTFKHTDDRAFTGLFGRVGGGGELENLGLTNTKITLDQLSASVGSLVGFVAFENAPVKIDSIVVNNVDIDVLDYRMDLFPSSTTGLTRVGGVAGMLNGVHLTNVSVSGNIDAAENSKAGHIGGLVGFFHGNGATTDSISRVLSTVNISHLSTQGFRYQETTVGGIVGLASSEQNTYHIYDVIYDGTRLSGGSLTGNIVGDIRVARATRAISTNPNLENLAGKSARSGFNNFEDSFFVYDGDGLNSLTLGGCSSLVESTCGGQGVTLEQLKLKSTFTYEDSPFSISGVGVSDEVPQLVFGHGTPVWTMVGDPVTLTYTLSDITTGYTYNGSQINLADLWTASSIFGNDYADLVAGTDYRFIYNSDTATGFTNAGVYNNISIAFLNDSYLDASSGNTNGSLTIDPKALTLSASKVYDGNANLTGSNITFGGLVGSETLTYTGATANSKNVADNSTNYITAMTLADGTGANSGLAGNYQLPTLNLANAPVTITAKGVIVNAAVGGTKVYDGTTDATINGAMIVGMMPGDNIAVNTGTFADANAGTKAVTPILSGDDAGNYFISMMPPVIGTITKKTLTLNGADDWVFAQDKDYDGLTSTDATILFGTGMASLTGFVGNQTVNVTAAGNFDTKDAGDDKDVTVNFTLADGANGGLAINYDLADIVKQAAINEKYITVTGSFTANNKTYDGTKDATFATNNLELDGVAEGEEIGLSGLGLEFVNANAGPGKTVNLIGGVISSTQTGDADNYIFTLGEVPATTTADILRKSLSIIGSSAADKAYDGNTTAQVTPGTVTGMVGSEAAPTVTATGVFDTANAGTGKTVTITYTLSDNNYSLASETNTADITKRVLAISGTQANKTYDGSAAATVTPGTLSNVVGGDAVGVTATGSFADANAGTGKSVRVTYTLDNANYSLAGETILADILKRALTITGSIAADKAYDGNTTAQVTPGTVTGMVGSEAAPTVTATGVFDTANAGTGKTVTITYTLSDNNYSLASETDTADITKRVLAISGTQANKTYDGSATATVTPGTLSNVVGGDAVGVTATGSFADANAGTGKSVTVTYTLDNANYSLAGETVLADILAKALSISGTAAASKTYDGNTTAAVTAGTLSGMVGDEPAPTVTATGTFANANAGAGKSVTVTYTLENANYTLAGETVLADIKPNDAMTNVAAAAAQPTLLAPESGQTGGNTGDVLLPASYLVNVAAKLDAGQAQAGAGNVVAVPPSVSLPFAQGTELTVLSTPDADEPTSAVTISQARQMTGGGASDGTREVRVPVSRNSLAEIVNGGVKLPGGVEQQLFVVKK